MEELGIAGSRIHGLTDSGARGGLPRAEQPAPTSLGEAPTKEGHRPRLLATSGEAEYFRGERSRGELGIAGLRAWVLAFSSIQ